MQTFPRLVPQPGVGYVPVKPNIFDRAAGHHEWCCNVNDAPADKVDASTKKFARIGWALTGGGNSDSIMPSAAPHVLLEIRNALQQDWAELLQGGVVRVSCANLSPEDRDAIAEASRLVVLLSLKGGADARDGAIAFMNRFSKHHELVHKWQLEKALDTWGIPDRPLACSDSVEPLFTLRFEYRFKWALQAPATNWYRQHPELKRKGPTAAQAFWPGMSEATGDIGAPEAFARLSAYIKAFHSNVVSEFRNFDKDCSGALSVDELRKAFSKLGMPLPASTWEKVIRTIDDNSTLELEYEELLAAMKR